MKGDVMVVDDSPANLRLLEDMLQEDGCEVRSFPGATLALVSALRSPPDLILLDVNMPGMNGYEMCERLKSLEQLSSVPVIFLSALHETEDKVRAFRAGGVDFISKPFQIDEVRARVETHLKLHELKRALQAQNEHLEELVEGRTRRLEVALQRIESDYAETVDALGRALDLRDNETSGHSQRVNGYSLHLGKALGCSEEELRQMSSGALLHDIGKIGIPDEILRKPGKLSPAETQIMRQHVRIGHEIVSQLSFLSGAAEIVLTHHESYDGKGYPRGLIGKEIPLAARVFAVADTFDAMTSDRPYRAALSFQTAREEIVRLSGCQFDPDVVDVFVEVPSHVWIHIRDDSLATAVSGKLIIEQTPAKKTRSVVG